MTYTYQEIIRIKDYSPNSQIDAYFNEKIPLSFIEKATKLFLHYLTFTWYKPNSSLDDSTSRVVDAVARWISSDSNNAFGEQQLDELAASMDKLSKINKHNLGQEWRKVDDLYAKIMDKLAELHTTFNEEDADDSDQPKSTPPLN